MHMGLPSVTATKMVRWRLKQQLLEAVIRPTTEAFNEIADYINMTVRRALIVDDVFVGLRIPEAVVIFLLQLSLDAFKAVGSEKDASNVINALEDGFNAAENRNGASTTVHLDRSWAKIPGYNFTYREAYDTQAHFVYGSLKYFLAEDGYIVGVPAPFEEDGVTDDIRSLRDRAVNDNLATLIEAREWTHIHSFIQGSSSINSCVYMLRLVFDRELLYAHNITMEDLITSISDALKGMSASVTFVPSGFADATIDIYPVNIIPDPNNAAYDNIETIIAIEREVKLLYSSFKVNLENIRVSGIPFNNDSKCPRVTGHGVRSIEYATLLTLKKVTQVDGLLLWALTQGVQPTEYDASNIRLDGKEVIYTTEHTIPAAENYDPNNLRIKNGSVVYSTDHSLPPAEEYDVDNIRLIGDSIVYTTERIRPQPSSTVLGDLAKKTAKDYYWPSYYIEEEGREIWAYEQNVDPAATPFDIENNSYVDPQGNIYYSKEATGDLRATEEQLSLLYSKTFCGAHNPDHLWVFELNLNRMSDNGVTHDEIIHFLNYSGITVVREVRHPFLQAIGYFYVSSPISPLAIIKRHLNPKSYTYESLYSRNRSLSRAAQAYVTALLGTTKPTPENVRAFLSDPEALELERISTYTYVVLRTERKFKLAKDAPRFIVKHFTNHALSQIVMFPWVDMQKTITNDWHTNVRVFGVDVTHNHFLVEPSRNMAACDSSNDIRHLILMTAFIFEKGMAAGISLRGIVSHGTGFFTEVMTEVANKQIFNAFLRPADRSTAVTFFTGGISSRNNMALRRAEVAAKDRLRDQEAARTALRFGKKSVTTAKTPKLAATALVVRSKLVAGDPYAGVATSNWFNVRELSSLVLPEDITIDREDSSYNELIVLSIAPETREQLSNLRNMKNISQNTHIKVVITPAEASFCGDIEAIYTQLLAYGPVLF